MDKAKAVAAAIVLAAAPSSAEEFETLSIILEQNFTDRDAEIVIAIETETTGLTELIVVGPSGRTVGVYRAESAGRHSAREFLLESPEEADMSALRDAYPEGIYQFRGVTSGGAQLSGTAFLSHALPLPPAPTTAAGTIRWPAAEGATAYSIEVENDDLGLSLRANIPGTETSFNLPAGWLIEEVEYELSLGAVNRFGNMTIVEMTISE